MFLRRFFPDVYIHSAYGIDYEGLYSQGYRGIIFDIDNTLVEHGAPANTRSVALVKGLKDMGFGVLLLSNNKEPRVSSFGNAVGARYIYKAGKPGIRNYVRAMELLGTGRGNTVFVGDQLFTDVWGAKRAGMLTCLTQPIDPKEEIQIVLKRYPEKLVLAAYRRECKRKGREYMKVETPWRGGTSDASD